MAANRVRRCRGRLALLLVHDPEHPEGIAQLAMAIAPEHVGRRYHGGRAGRDGMSVAPIDVVHDQHQGKGLGELMRMAVIGKRVPRISDTLLTWRCTCIVRH